MAQEEVKDDCKLRPSLLEQHLRQNGQRTSAATLARKRTEGKGANPAGRSRKDQPNSSKQTFRDRFDETLADWEKETGRQLIWDLLTKSPVEAARIRANLEPKNVNVDHTIKQVVFHVVSDQPPLDWQTPQIDGHVQQAIEDEIVDQAMEDDGDA